MKGWYYVTIFFLNALSVGLLLPIMCLIFTGKGGTVKELSIGLSILSLAIIIFEIPSGLFADLFGRRDCFCWSLVCKTISLCLSALFLCKLLIPQDYGSSDNSASSEKSGISVLFSALFKQFSLCIREIRLNRNLLFLLILILFTGIFLSNTERFWQVELEKLLLDKQLLWIAGILSFCGFVSCTAGSFFSSKAIGKGFGNRKIYFLSRIAMFAGLTAMALM